MVIKTVFTKMYLLLFYICNTLFLLLTDGNTLLGSSDLTGRYWKGSVFHFDSPTDILEKKSVSGIGFNSGVTVGKYLDGESQVCDFFTKIFV
jgi:hypothetical protein